MSIDFAYDGTAIFASCLASACYTLEYFVTLHTMSAAAFNVIGIIPPRFIVCLEHWPHVIAFHKHSNMLSMYVKALTCSPSPYMRIG